MKLVTPRDHKFAALHGAVWSGGSFVYVPPGVSVTIPLKLLFSTERTGSRTVRAYPDHCGRGCIPAFYRGLFRPEVQRGEPPCRLCGAVRGEKCKTALLHHRELVQEYVLETAVGTVEGVQTSDDGICADSHGTGKGDGGHGISGIVSSGNGKFDFTDGLFVVHGGISPGIAES